MDHPVRRARHWVRSVDHPVSRAHLPGQPPQEPHHACPVRPPVPLPCAPGPPPCRVRTCRQPPSPPWCPPPFYRPCDRPLSCRLWPLSCRLCPLFCRPCPLFCRPCPLPFCRPCPLRTSPPCRPQLFLPCRLHPCHLPWHQIPCLSPWNPPYPCYRLPFSTAKRGATGWQTGSSWMVEPGRAVLAALRWSPLWPCRVATG